MNRNQKPIKVALISCGLGRVRRGYEVAALRWYEAINREKELQIRVFCGGHHPGFHHVPNIPRGGKFAAILRRFNLIQDGARLEQLSMAVGLLPRLLMLQPDVVWLQEYPLARFLQKVCNSRLLKCRLIFCNGAPVGSQEYQHFDFIQHLHPASYEEGVEHRINPRKMTMLPHCSLVPENVLPRDTVRKQYGLAEDDWVVTCVAAWNCHHKRIDYLIKETAALNDPQVKLVLCGHPEEETTYLRQLGHEKLPGRITWLTLPPNKIYDIISASDVFVLPSLNEGLPAVLIEASLCGVPIICHSHPSGKYIFKNTPESLADLSVEGNLTRRLTHLKASSFPQEKLDAMKKDAIQSFSGSALAPQFVQMVKQALNSSSGEDL